MWIREKTGLGMSPAFNHVWVVSFLGLLLPVLPKACLEIPFRAHHVVGCKPKPYVNCLVL